MIIKLWPLEENGITLIVHVWTIHCFNCKFHLNGNYDLLFHTQNWGRCLRGRGQLAPWGFQTAAESHKDKDIFSPSVEFLYFVRIISSVNCDIPPKTANFGLSSSNSTICWKHMVKMSRRNVAKYTTCQVMVAMQCLNCPRVILPRLRPWLRSSISSSMAQLFSCTVAASCSELGNSGGSAGQTGVYKAMLVS